METTAPAILEIGIVLLAAVAAGFVARRLGLPAVVGYLVVGLAVSPFTPGYVADPEQLHLLADFGVVLLLFEVGIEVDLRAPAPGAARASSGPHRSQMLLTTAHRGGRLRRRSASARPGRRPRPLRRPSSSVVVVNITRSRRRDDRPSHRAALLGWSVAPGRHRRLLAAVLLAASRCGGRARDRRLLGLVAFASLAVVTARSCRASLRRLRDEHDLFLITSVASGLALAGIGAVVFGVPLALAAFVGGLAITESPMAAEARRRLLPFRDVFAVLFFVAIGTLLDPGPARRPALLGVFLALIVVAKGAVVYGLARLCAPAARPLQLAVGLGQMGEFGFVLGSALVAAGAITGSTTWPCWRRSW